MTALLGVVIAVVAVGVSIIALRKASEANDISRQAAKAAERSAQAAERTLVVEEARSRAAPRVMGATYEHGVGRGRVVCGIANDTGAAGTLTDVRLVLLDGREYPTSAVATLAGGTPRAEVTFEMPTDHMAALGDSFDFAVAGTVTDALGSRPFAANYQR